MKDWFSKNGLKFASYAITGLGLILGLAEGKIKDKEDEKRIEEMVIEYMKKKEAK